MSLVIARVSGSVDTSEYDRYLTDTRDPVRRNITLRAMRVQEEVTRRCPVRTGKLRSTIRKNDGREGEKPYTDVVAGIDGVTDYLGYVLYGTSPHLIEPHNDRANPHLRFVVGGMVVFAKAVHHPGSRANDFLTKSLPAAAAI